MGRHYANTFTYERTRRLFLPQSGSFHLGRFHAAWIVGNVATHIHRVWIYSYRLIKYTDHRCVTLQRWDAVIDNISRNLSIYDMLVTKGYAETYCLRMFREYRHYCTDVYTFVTAKMGLFRHRMIVSIFREYSS